MLCYEICTSVFKRNQKNVCGFVPQVTKIPGVNVFITAVPMCVYLCVFITAVLCVCLLLCVLCVFITAVPITITMCVCVYYCSTYYKAVRVVVYYCST